jgi:hypothetical protein
MSSDGGDGKKGKLGFILLILHLIAVISVITFLHTKFTNPSDFEPANNPYKKLLAV